MSLDPGHELDRLEERLRAAEAITPELISEVVAQVCARFAAQGAAAKARVGRLMEAGAWTDAALALLELELPQWRLRRMICEDGEWLCSLSKEPWLPLGLDDAIEAAHEVLSLAILIVLVQARRAAAARAKQSTSVPQVRREEGHAVSCDNFA